MCYSEREISLSSYSSVPVLPAAAGCFGRGQDSQDTPKFLGHHLIKVPVKKLLSEAAIQGESPAVSGEKPNGASEEDKKGFGH